MMEKTNYSIGSMYNDGEDKKRAREETLFLPKMHETMHKTRRMTVDHPSFTRLVGTIPTTLRVDELKKTNNVVTMNVGGGGGGGIVPNTSVGNGLRVIEEVKEWADWWMMGWEDVNNLTNWKYNEFDSYQYLIFENDDHTNDGEEIVWEFHDVWDLSLCH